MRIINVFSIALAVLFSQSPFVTAAPAPGNGDYSGSSCSDTLSTLQNNLAGPLGQMQYLNRQNATAANLAAPMANVASMLNGAANQLNALTGLSPGGATGTTPGSGSGTLGITGTGTIPGTGTVTVTGGGTVTGTGTTTGTILPSGTTDPSLNIALSIRLLGAILLSIVTILGNLLTVVADVSTLLNAIASVQLNIALNNLINAVLNLLNITLTQFIAGLPTGLVATMGNMLTLTLVLGVNLCAPL